MCEEKATTKYYLERINSDKCKEAKEFYKDLWGGIFDEDEDTGGEVIISYKIPVDCYIRCLPNGEVKKNNKDTQKYIDDSIRIGDIVDPDKLFERFYVVSHSRANTMPLIPNGYKSLNPLKGIKGGYYDFPDLFYADWRNGERKLKNYLADKKNSEYYEEFSSPDSFCYPDSFCPAWQDNERKLMNYLADKKNRKYYKKFGSDFNEFVKHNFLQDFFADDEDSDSEFRQLAPQKRIWEGKNILHYNTNFNKLEPSARQYYEKHMHERFLHTAIDIIEKRAKRLAEAWQDMQKRNAQK